MLIKMEQHQQELELKATTDQHIKTKRVVNMKRQPVNLKDKAEANIQIKRHFQTNIMRLYL